MSRVVGDLVHTRDKLIHELPVVRDHENGAGVVLEIILEPEQREEVEVIGRLVQQEEVGLHDQQPRKVRAHDPAAAHLARGPVEVALLEAEAVEHFLGLRFDLGIAEGVEFRVRLEVLGNVDGAGLLEFAQPGFEPGDFADASGGDLEDGLAAGGLALLGQVADHGPLVALDRAGVGLIVTEDDGEEGRLPRAIRPDQRDALAVVHLHRGVLEERAAADGFPEVSDGEHG